MQGIWLFVLLVFFAAVLLMQGTVVPVFSESRKMRKRIAARLSNVAQSGDGTEFASILREKYLRDLSPLERTLESLPAMERLSRLIEQSGRDTPAYRVVVSALALSVAASIGTWIVVRQWQGASAAAV